MLFQCERRAGAGSLSPAELRTSGRKTLAGLYIFKDDFIVDYSELVDVVWMKKVYRHSHDNSKPKIFGPYWSGGIIVNFKYSQLCS